jgi:O-antigen/teichoic acid export membrane protein
MGVVYIVFLTRLISQADIGTFGVLTFILGLVQVLGMLALPNASIRYIAHFLAGGNREKARAVVTRVLQVSVILSIIAFASVFALSNWISTELSISPVTIQVLALASIFTVLYFQVLAFLQGLQMMREMAAINLVYSAVQYALALGLVFAGFGLLGIMLGWFVALAMAFSIGLALTVKKLGILGKPHELKPLLKFSAPLYISGILGFVILWVDQLFVLAYFGQEVFGQYNIANRAAVVPGLISSALIAALFPKLSQLYAETGKNSLENAFKATTRYAVFVGFPLILIIAVLANPIITLFAGATYVPAALPLTILCVAALFGTIGVAITPTFFTMERTAIASLVIFASILADTFSSYALVAFLGTGMIGAAIAKVVAAAVGLILGAIVLERFIRVKFDTGMLWRVVLSCFFMVVAVLGFDVLRQFLSGAPYSFLVFRLFLLPVYVIIAFVTYFAAIVALGAIQRQDLELFREYLPNKLKWVVKLLERFVRNKKAS